MSTRQPEHHPSEAVLVAYGSGSLGEGLALVVATHLLYCAACRSKARDVEALGGALLEELPPAALAEDAYAKILPRLGAVEAKPAPQHRPPANGGFSPPGPLSDYLGGHISENDWRRIMPGLSRVAVLPRGKTGANTQLLRVSPGTALAHHGHHGHRGLELTVVLQGGYSDDLGHFGMGDVAETDDSIRHRPMADPGADCICLIATSGRLRFSGLIGRLIQPFIGM
jgi:putative transcriptional regulator